MKMYGAHGQASFRPTQQPFKGFPGVAQPYFKSRWFHKGGPEYIISTDDQVLIGHEDGIWGKEDGKDSWPDTYWKPLHLMPANAQTPFLSGEKELPPLEYLNRLVEFGQDKGHFVVRQKHESGTKPRDTLYAFRPEDVKAAVEALSTRSSWNIRAFLDVSMVEDKKTAALVFYNEHGEFVSISGKPDPLAVSMLTIAAFKSA